MKMHVPICVTAHPGSNLGFDISTSIAGGATRASPEKNRNSDHLAADAAVVDQAALA